MAALLYLLVRPIFVMRVDSPAMMPLKLQAFLARCAPTSAARNVRIPASRILKARDTITVVNTQLTYVSGKIENATTDAILRFAKVLQNIEDIEKAIQSTSGIIDDIQQKLSSNVKKDGLTASSSDDLAQIRQRYEHLLREIVAELSLVVTRKSEDIERLNAVRQNVQSVFAVSDEVALIAREAKMLAINAAIEAANAGEHGRTFAVVADAVLKVANRADESSRKIQTQVTQANGMLERNIAQIAEAMDVEARFISSTIVIIQDVFLSVIDSLFQLSHRIGAVIGGMMGDTSPMKQEVQALTVNLQFEDMTKQVSQHIVQMLEQVSSELVGSMKDQADGMGADGSRGDLLQRFRQVATMESERDIADRLLLNENQAVALPATAASDSNEAVQFWDDAPSSASEAFSAPAPETEAGQQNDGLGETDSKEEKRDDSSNGMDADVTFF